ncbi:MAG TPA: S8 family serine peptidase [Gaiellaceae bacterium]
MLVPLAATGKSTGNGNGSTTSSSFYITDTLLQQAQSDPTDTFAVIVQGDGSKDADHLAHQIANASAKDNKSLAKALSQADSALASAQQALTQATQNATQTAAAAAADVTKAALTLKKSDVNAASKAAAAAAAARQALIAAQNALTQAQAADAAANTAVSNAATDSFKKEIRAEFSSIAGVAATLTGDEINQLAQNPSGLISITPDTPVVLSGNGNGNSSVPFSSTQTWPYESNTSNNWTNDANPSFAANMGSIAIVDSGIDSTRSDFGGRVIGSVNLSTLPDAQGPGDGSGHGTFVAGVAAGGLSGMTGADPAAKLVDVKVMGAGGEGMTSDIINACQWILNNKAKYNIKVANFSLHSDITAPFYIDPLDRAVEQLWFNGITVVAAAGNYGVSDTTPSGVIYSPGDDPFVITVGASDTDSSTNVQKATMAPWSAWGYTPDGFFKPELSAPGRYMIGPVPPTSELPTERPDSVTSPGYMQLSGTSFAAPVVAGAAANILAANPTWTPDQVKGALMLTAKAAHALTSAAGVGVIMASNAAGVSNPPNPNLALEQWVQQGAAQAYGNSYSFDGASWNSAAQSSASWNSASWNSASWNSASWNSASWNSVSWNSASWNSASWNSASWNSASWNSVAATSASQEDAADGANTEDPSNLVLSNDDIAALLADPTFDPSTLPPDLLAAYEASIAPPAAAPAPAGPTGSTGAVGPTGPTGVQAAPATTTTTTATTPATTSTSP